MSKMRRSLGCIGVVATVLWLWMVTAHALTFGCD